MILAEFERFDFIWFLTFSLAATILFLPCLDDLHGLTHFVDEAIQTTGFYSFATNSFLNC